MARRRSSSDDDDVSLFPFLSIIAAVIGVLTLMIAAVTLGQMNQDDVKEAVENAIEMEQVTASLEQAEAEIATLKLQLSAEQSAALSTASARQNEVVKTRAELDALIKQLTAVEQQIQAQQKIKIVIPEVPPGERETVADMEEQLQRIKDRLAVLQKELNERKGPAKEAEVSILPGGSGLSIVPSFVECAAGAIVLHTEEPPLRIRTNEAAANKKFVALLNRVANDNKQTIVFLIRSDGLSTYRAVRAICEAGGVRHGKLPVVGNGRLDFSHFRK